MSPKKTSAFFPKTMGHPPINPTFYRLSQELQEFAFPPYLGIQRVDLCCYSKYEALNLNLELRVIV